MERNHIVAVRFQGLLDPTSGPGLGGGHLERGLRAEDVRHLTL